MRFLFGNSRSAQDRKEAEASSTIDRKPESAPWARPLVPYAYLGNRTGLALTHAGHKILVFTDDFAIAPHIIANGLWEPNIEQAILRLIKPAFTVVEVGCNFGYHTIAMAQAVGDDGHVYGFEANPKLLTLLHWSIALNGLLPRTTLFSHAVTDKVGEVRFDYDPIATGGGHVVTKARRESVNAITTKSEPLDVTLKNLNSADLIRMDAEGCEPLIIAGAIELIGRSPQLRIVTEWSPNMMRGHSNVQDYISLIRGFGFMAWRIDNDSLLVPTQLEQLEKLPHCEIVFSRDDPTLPAP